MNKYIDRRCTGTRTYEHDAYAHIYKGLHPQKQILHQSLHHRVLTSTYVQVTQPKVNDVRLHMHKREYMYAKYQISRFFFNFLFDRHSQLYLRCVTLLPSTLQFEQSVKGKKEINSTLTNVNKVLSGQQRCIDSIKQANVPLACLSFNYITGSLSHILPRGQAILHHIWALVHMCGYACACIITCVWLYVCLWTVSLYIYWNEQLSLGHLCESWGLQPC